MAGRPAAHAQRTGRPARADTPPGRGVGATAGGPTASLGAATPPRLDRAAHQPLDGPHYPRGGRPPPPGTDEAAGDAERITLSDALERRFGSERFFEASLSGSRGSHDR